MADELSGDWEANQYGQAFDCRAEVRREPTAVDRALNETVFPTLGYVWIGFICLALVLGVVNIVSKVFRRGRGLFE